MYSNTHGEGQDSGPGAWRAFNLVYLALFFAGWIWEPPERRDLIAAAIALAVFLPVYLEAYEGSEPRFLLHAGIMEAISWCMVPFAGVHGVFHVYACVQCAFQRPRSRALWLIVAMTLAQVLLGLLFIDPWYAVGLDVIFGLVVGIGCTAAADGIERERRLRRSRVLERQRAALAERERIAHDLHDLLGQTLTTVALKAEVAARLVERDPQRAAREFEDAAGAARKALTEIRAAVYDMTAVSVETELALARQALDAAGITLDVANPLPQVPPALGKVLGLTIREATTNIVRHSGARRARIEIVRDGPLLSLTVIDDGRGDSREFEEGAGLTGVRRRIAALGGETSISRGNGMRIDISLPLPTATAASA